MPHISPSWSNYGMFITWIWKKIDHVITKTNCIGTPKQIDGLVQERHNSIANALELRLSYTNPLRYTYY